MSNFVECIAAVGTVAMAIMTWLSIKQNEQHHMDDSRPILMIYSNSGKDLEDQNNRMMMIRCPDNQEPSQNRIPLIIDGNIKNIGKGIAKNIKIEIRFQSDENMAVVLELQPIEPGESMPIGESVFRSRLKEFRFFVDEDNNFKKNCYNSICRKLYKWVVYLYYEDIYNNKFATIHDLYVEKPGNTGKIISWSQLSTKETHVLNKYYNIERFYS